MIALGGPRLNDSTGRAYTETQGTPQQRPQHHYVSMIALGGPTLKPQNGQNLRTSQKCLNDSTGRAYTET